MNNYWIKFEAFVYNCSINDNSNEGKILKLALKVVFTITLGEKGTSLSFFFWVLAFLSHLELTPFLFFKSRFLTRNPLSFVDNLLYCTQKPQYFVTLKVTKPKLRLNFIPSHTCGAYSYLLHYQILMPCLLWGKQMEHIHCKKENKNCKS